MIPLPDLEVARPGTLDEALAQLAREGARALAGGTDLIPNLRRGLAQPRLLVDLSAVAGFGAIERTSEGWRIGAGATLEAIAAHAGLARELPALAQAAAQVAGPGHRSAATIGGNLCQDTRCVFYNQSAWWREANGWCLKRDGDTCHVAPQGNRCHAAFSGDVAPALLALDASVDVLAPEGVERTPLGAIYRDDGAAHLTLAPQAIVAAVHVPHAAPDTRSAYRKARVRGAMDFPLAGVAVALRTDGGALAALAVGVSGTNSFPFRLTGTDALLGSPLDERALDALAKLVQKQVTPMRSTVTASNYRRLAAANLARRLAGELAAGA